MAYLPFQPSLSLGGAEQRAGGEQDLGETSPHNPPLAHFFGQLITLGHE
jgi:hypothetical protein